MNGIVVRDVKVRSVPKKTLVYNRFRGVDFSTDPALVERVRSPFALNLVSDIAGMPEKRLGWRKIYELNDKVWSLFYGDVGGDGGQMAIAHVGAGLYDIALSGLGYTLIRIVPSQQSCGFFMRDETKGYFYFLCGGRYIRYDGLTDENVSDDAYIPTVLISKNPDGTGGTIYESINLITDYRKESFLGNNSDVVYKLASKGVTVDKVEVMNASGEFITMTEGAGNDYTVDNVNGEINFTTPHDVIVAGQDNVLITYQKTVSGYADRIKRCTIVEKYGYGGSNRVFLSGNPDYKNYVWYSDIYRPDYFPDTNFLVVGDDNTAVMGFARLGKYLMIIKESNRQDSTVYQCWGGLDADGKVQFYIEQGVAGAGAVAKGSFSTLGDEPLFLSTNGVCAVTNSNILAERTLRNRSYYVDSWLMKESNLKDAVSCEWNGYYILCVNSKCYVLDGNNKSYRPNYSSTSADYVYDCYYWDNIPAVSWLPVEDELFFGTADGRICKFNTDKTVMDRFNDNGFQGDDPDDGSDGEAIHAVWSTKNDDDGASWLYKSMQKKGCSVTIKPFYRSSVKVYAIKDGNGEMFLRYRQMDIFAGFDDIDFERFTFNTNTNPQDVYLKKKIKKYKRLQIIVRNSEKGEGFGIFQITKTYRVGNYAKK